LTVDREQALPLGMLVNEVVSNAFKYAFEDAVDGKLSISLAKDNDDAVLTIRDTGKGFNTEDVRHGMGSRLITGFVSQQRAIQTYTFDGGTVFTLRMPLE